MSADRPNFETPAAYVENCELALRRGNWPWPPATRQELIAALDEFGATGHDHLFRPCASAMKLMGLPPDYGRKPKVLSERRKAQFLQTLDDDSEFREAMRVMLPMEATTE